MVPCGPFRWPHRSQSLLMQLAWWWCLEGLRDPCLQRSISFRNVSQPEAAPPPPPSSAVKTRVISATVSSPCSAVSAPRASTGAACTGKRRDSKLWSETFDVRLGATQPLSPKEIKRQEVRGGSKASTHGGSLAFLPLTNPNPNPPSRQYSSWLRGNRTWWRT